MVTDVYNSGKGFAFVTFDRKEDADTATQVSPLYFNVVIVRAGFLNCIKWKFDLKYCMNSQIIKKYCKVNLLINYYQLSERTPC